MFSQSRSHSEARVNLFESASIAVSQTAPVNGGAGRARQLFAVVENAIAGTHLFAFLVPAFSLPLSAGACTWASIPACAFTASASSWTGLPPLGTGVHGRVIASLPAGDLVFRKSILPPSSISAHARSSGSLAGCFVLRTAQFFASGIFITRGKPNTLMCASATDDDEKKNGGKEEQRDAALAAKEAAAEKKAEERKEKTEEKAALAEKKAEEKATVAEKKAEEKTAAEKKEEKRPLRFLFVSLDGLIGDLAWEVKKEGHDVKYFIRDKSQRDVCDGFVQKTEDWKAEKDWADVIVFDDIGFGKDAEELRKDGKPVVGGSLYTDKLEDDREFGQDELKKAGVLIAPHWDFTDFDAAIAFVKATPGRYVVKPSGKAQNEKELSFIGQEEDGNDVLNVLEHYKKTWAKKLNSFQIQKFVSGVEVAVGAFFNGKEFVTPVFINFEHKKMFPGDIGPNTGEMGTSGFWSPPNRIFRDTLEKMAPALAASGYAGYLDLNCIVNAKGIYPLEWTSRFGYPTISLQIEGVTDNWGEFLLSLAKGEAKELKVKKGFQICVVVAVPPFPFDDPAAFKKYSEEATVLFKKPNYDGVHLGDVKLVEDEWLLAGNSGYAVIVTGNGQTMEDARRQAYKRVENIMIPNMFYRTDIGERWVRDSDLLHMWGYLY